MTDIPVHETDVDDSDAVIIVETEDGMTVVQVPTGVRVIECYYPNGKDPRDFLTPENTLAVDVQGERYVRQEYRGPYENTEW